MQPARLRPYHRYRRECPSLLKTPFPDDARRASARSTSRGETAQTVAWTEVLERFELSCFHCRPVIAGLSISSHNTVPPASSILSSAKYMPNAAVPPAAKAHKTSDELRLTLFFSSAPTGSSSPGLLIVLLAAARANGQPLPIAVVDQSRNEHNLADMIGGVRQRALNRKRHGVRFATNGDDIRQVVGR
jgi:hypothetical protein